MSDQAPLQPDLCPWCQDEPAGENFTRMGERCREKIAKQFEEGKFLG